MTTFKTLLFFILFAFSAISAELKDSVYHLTIQTKGGVSHGTAFALEIENHRYIITAGHVIDSPETPKINGLPLKIVMVDKFFDIAVLELNCNEFKEYLPYDPADLAFGDKVHSIGYPEAKFSVAEGIVNHLEDKDSLQVSAFLKGVYPGSSGGPVFRGNKVVGIIVAVDGVQRGAEIVPIRGAARFVPIKRLLQMILLKEHVNIEKEK